MANSSPTYTPDEFPFQDSQPCMLLLRDASLCYVILLYAQDQYREFHMYQRSRIIHVSEFLDYKHRIMNDDTRTHNKVLYSGSGTVKTPAYEDGRLSSWAFQKEEIQTVLS